MTEANMWLVGIALLGLLAMGLWLINRICRLRFLRVYNWNGNRYCYLGRSCIHKRNDTYVIKLRERVADISYTTDYRFLADKAFVRKNRYRNLYVYAGTTRVWMPIEEQMEQNLYYRFPF